MLNPILTFRPLAQPAAFPLTDASSYFAHSSDFAHSNDDITAQPDETDRHQSAHACAISLFQIKTHAYSPRRPGFARIWATNSKPLSSRRLIT
ncbi:hypothetical protein MRO95_05950 [Dickeya dianthicola]|uniref:Uncharacterized protein n=1 Tax=Dickeya dianthicola TaxID=204039 RepID=A0AAX1C4W9_9GAMM|nr:hypothetical protein [Dickeya dianthicola]MCI4195537.1 hypothetical protein [Dickeya dianthicola]MCI4201704.1 hypothetical protein [Dickeya dianthicola]MCI4211074.1 hypothetical protein [Dickeya dianthicola]MZG33211.1 hypothetical protein [Dickeya dianthicola]PWD72225.1 hypothetical protein DF213_13935 [Dickeya dianthicola]